MSEIRVIDPVKLTKTLQTARENTSRAELVKAGKNGDGEVFTVQDLYNWEKGKNLPHPKKLPFLLAALGIDFEAISSPVTTN